MTAATLAAIPLDPTTFGEDLLTLVRRLVDLLNRESETLEKGRPSELAPIVEEKSRLFTIYRTALLALRDDGGLLAGSRPATKSNLKALTAALHERAETLGKRLQHKKQINEGLLKSVGQEVARRNAPVQAYGKNATLRSATAQQKLLKPASLILNQSV